MFCEKAYTRFEKNGSWNEGEIQNTLKKSCPICGYPMQLKYKKAYGLRLYICTNEPEICGFMTNDYRAGVIVVGAGYGLGKIGSSAMDAIARQPEAAPSAC